MKNKKIIVFFIITNIILIGVICSLISEKGNVIKEKKVIKEMSESTQVLDLQNQINQLNASHEEYAVQVQTNKKKLAEAITNQGVETSENATIDEMITNIEKILQARTSDATATAEDIANGKTAYVNGSRITGTYAHKVEKVLVGSYSDICYQSVQYNIANIYSNYSSLTKDNFVIELVKLRGHGYSGDWMTNTQSCTYNASTGILTCKLGLNGNPYVWVHVTANIYMII